MINLLLLVYQKYNVIEARHDNIRKSFQIFNFNHHIYDSKIHKKIFVGISAPRMKKLQIKEKKE